MPITKTDVLDVLGDLRLRNIRFSVGPISVNSTEYDKVADCIASGAINVKPGSGPVAMYYPQLDTLRTRAGDPPLGFDARSNLVHECTHIISDVNKVRVSRLADEAAAYLAQLTYMLLIDPTIPEPPIGLPLNNMMRQCMHLVTKYKLGSYDGLGAVIDHGDVQSLAHVIHAIPDYADIRENEQLAANGVSMTSGEAQEFYRLQLSRFMNQQLADDMRKDMESLITTKVRYSAHENYVTWDPELLGLFDQYGRGKPEQKQGAQNKLLYIFLTVDQRNATQLSQRLSAATKGDFVASRFQSVFPPPAKSALLAALHLDR